MTHSNKHLARNSGKENSPLNGSANEQFPPADAQPRRW